MSETLRELRQRAGWNQKQLARLAGIDPATLSRLEAGLVRNPEYKTVMALAIALSSTPEIVARAVMQAVAEAA